jgi:LPS export ABC transporter protein LptC
MIFIGIKHISKLYLPALLASLLLLQACENDIKKIRQLSASQLNMDIDTVHGVEITFSDSAHVKFQVLSPLLLQYTGKVQYNLMPRGVHVIIYDNDLSQMGNLTADTGIQRESANKIEFHKNVVARNKKGETFKSDELIWDQATKRMHSSKPVQITMANGDITNGIGFTSDQTFNHWTIDKMTGIFNVDEKDTNTLPTH